MTTPGTAPKVSVIIPTYNRAALLPRAANSVLAQTCQDFEILIVDDCSADDTPQVIAAFTDPRIRAFRHDVNRGQSAAINTGLANARGEYTALLDDDCEFTPDSLADRLTVLEAAPQEVALVYGWADVVDSATGTVTPSYRFTLEGVEALEYALTTNTVAHTVTFFFRTSAAREIGGYDEYISLKNEHYFFTTMLSKHRIIALPKVVVRGYAYHGYPAMGDSNETNKRAKDKYFEIFIHRFSEDLKQRPKCFAALLVLRSVNAMECRQVVTSLRAFVAAVKRRPFTLANIRYALRLARIFLFYATPLSRYREQARSVQRVLRLRKE